MLLSLCFLESFLIRLYFENSFAPTKQHKEENRYIVLSWSQLYSQNMFFILKRCNIVISTKTCLLRQG